MNNPWNTIDDPQTLLERRILHGLAAEWQAILSILDTHLRRRMRLPLFRLDGMRRKLACWSGERHEMAFSREFVLNHSWDSVCEVLRHEMAHQLADLLGSGAQPESSHGPSFHAACHLLRANPAASGSYPPLDQAVKGACRDDQDRIMLKIRKLLALAESGNPHEAETAMRKAHELIVRYEIESVRESAERNFFSVFLGKPELRHTRDRYHLAGLLQLFYFVQGIWIPAYVMEKGKMGRVLEISGTASNIQIAGYVHDFVLRHIRQTWDAYNKDKGLNSHRRTDFAVGIVEGFRSRLEKDRAAIQESSRTTDNGTRLPAIINDPALKFYMKQRYPHTATFNRNASGQDETVRRDGRREGEKLVLSKGIHERHKGETFLIE